MDFPVGPGADSAPKAGDLGSIPGRGTRFRVPQLKVPHGTIKDSTCCS